MLLLILIKFNFSNPLIFTLTNSWLSLIVSNSKSEIVERSKVVKEESNNQKALTEIFSNFHYHPRLFSNRNLEVVRTQNLY